MHEMFLLARSPQDSTAIFKQWFHDVLLSSANEGAQHDQSNKKHLEVM